MATRSITPPEGENAPCSIISPSKRRLDMNEDNSAPLTPSKRSRDSRQGNDLDLLVARLSKEFGFDLTGIDWTPSRHRGRIQGECRAVIQLLYYHDRDGLDSCCRKFRTLFPSKDRTMASFCQLLKAQKQTSQLSSPNFGRSNMSSRVASLNTSFVSTTTGIDTAQTSFTNASQEAPILPPETVSTTYNTPTFCTQDLLHLTENWENVAGQRDIPKEVIEVKKNIPSLPLAISKDALPMEHYTVRDLPHAGLFVDDTPTSILNASPRVRYELFRLSNECKTSVHILAEGYVSSWEDHTTFCSAMKSKTATNDAKIFSQTSHVAWEKASHDSGSEHVIRAGTLCFETDGNKKLFKLKLTPLRYEKTSTRFFRKFGAHRFLKILIPPFKHASPLVKQSQTHFHRRIQEWLNHPNKPFMGYDWNAFSTKSTKGPRVKNDDGKWIDESGWYQVYFFATVGVNLKSVSIADLLNWFMPIQRNLNIPYCKAFARFELGLSMTYATVEFKPSQIRHVPDMLANGELEDQSLNDKKLRWYHHHDPKKPRVMNDGCARMSLAAAKEIWLKLKNPGHCPSVFQARIGPWKGLWFVSDLTRDSVENVWLEVNDSQQKFECHTEDYDEKSYDPRRMTFEVVSWSRRPSPSEFYVDYLPILEDRGVHRTCMKKFVLESLDGAREDLQTSLGSPETFLRWLDTNIPVSDETLDGKDVLKAMMPKSRGGKVKKLLESGFWIGEATHESSYLSDLVQETISKYFKELSSSLDLPLPRSTFVYGIADPYGCLGPSEIHFVSSNIFPEEMSPILHDVEVLVARHPALRRSDIQKVKAVFRQELRHLTDVVVFPTRGSMALASKLQGGDYDGDMFWMCWQEEIVQNFCNAPAPNDLPPPEHFGITVDRRKLGDLFSAPENHESDRFAWDFLSKSFSFAWQPQYLGICTNYLNDLCYATNSLDSKAIEELTDLHDYLVDSAKNGYTFGDDQWNQIKSKVGKTKLEKPAYKTALKIDFTPRGFKERLRTPVAQRNIVDHLIFDIARPRALDIVNDMEALIKPSKTFSAIVSDPHISGLHSTLLSTKAEPIKIVVSHLRNDVEALCKAFSIEYAHKKNQKSFSMMVEDENTSSAFSSYDEDLAKILQRYKALQPHKQYRNDPTVRVWLETPAHHVPSYWECVKASFIVQQKIRLAFDIAGDVLCYLKAYSSAEGPPRPIVVNVFQHMKMKKVKTAATNPLSVDNAAGTDSVELNTETLEEDGQQDENEDEDEDEDYEYTPFSLDGTIDLPPPKHRLRQSKHNATPRGTRQKRMHSPSPVPKPTTAPLPDIIIHPYPRLPTDINQPRSPSSEESDFQDALEEVAEMGVVERMDGGKHRSAEGVSENYEDLLWLKTLSQVSEQMASQSLDDGMDDGYRAFLETEAEAEGEVREFDGVEYS